MASLTFLAVLSLAVTSSWCQSTTTPKPHHTHKPRPTMVYDDVLTTLRNKGQFNTLLDLLSLTGLDTVLNNANELTLFAPTDDAFARLPAGALDSLKNDIPTLTSVLKYHAAAESSNMHHANDKVLKTFNNDMPLRINQYSLVHSTTAEGVNITERDIHIKNGFLQVLDGVLETPSGNVMDIIGSRGDLTTLNAFLTSTGLDKVIRADQNITVFAPTDEAFAKLDSSIVQYLQTNSKELSEVLLFHVIARTTLYSIGMKHSMTFVTSDKHKDKIMTLEDFSTGELFVNSAKVTERDLSATNGVVHTIDDVLVPVRVVVGMQDQGLTVG